MGREEVEETFLFGGGDHKCFDRLGLEFGVRYALEFFKSLERVDHGRFAEEFSGAFVGSVFAVARESSNNECAKKHEDDFKEECK